MLTLTLFLLFSIEVPYAIILGFALILIGILMGWKLAQQSIEDCDEYNFDDISEFLIGNKVAIPQIKNYDKDIVSGFISIRTIFSYLNYVKELSSNKNIKLSGIRIFLARYSNERRGINNKGQETFVIYPTVEIGDQHFSFDPELSEKFTGSNPLKESDVVTIKNFLRKFGDAKINNEDSENDDVENGINGVALNHTQMSPPRGQ